MPAHTVSACDKTHSSPSEAGLSAERIPAAHSIPPVSLHAKHSSMHTCTRSFDWDGLGFFIPPWQTSLTSHASTQTPPEQYMHGSVREYRGNPANIFHGHFAWGYTEQIQINDCSRGRKCIPVSRPWESPPTKALWDHCIFQRNAWWEIQCSTQCTFLVHTPLTQLEDCNYMKLYLPNFTAVWKYAYALTLHFKLCRQIGQDRPEELDASAVLLVSIRQHR